MDKTLKPYFSAAISKNGNPDKWSGQVKQSTINKSIYNKLNLKNNDSRTIYKISNRETNYS